MVAAGVFGIVLYPVSALLGAGVAIALIIVFAVVLKKHLRNIELQHHYERLKIINQQELNCVCGDFSAYPSGSRYEDAKHFYTSDLDIFGAHSLFRYIDRTTSPSGSDMLADWLRAPASTSEIKARQQAVRELAGMVDIRQEMQATGLKHKNISRELPAFIEWLHSKAEFLHNRKLLRIMQILPVFTVAVSISAILGWIPSVVVLLPVSVHLLIYGSVIKKINYLHQQVSNKVEFLSTYTELFEIVTAVKFSSPYLNGLLHFVRNDGALRQIQTLRNRIRKLDYRLNMAYAPLNILFFFDYKHLVWLESWRTREGRRLPEWFDAMAKIEALSSFANMLHNNPSWTMPEIRDDYFHLEAKNTGHPLIHESERVCNDFSLAGAGHIAIVTGSNMSGKSTFERSIGVNMVLALAGAPVCADKFNVSNCNLYTYMRIADNLEEHTSSFYAELKRLKQLIDLSKAPLGGAGGLFFLLDEVLRGTNSRDRQIGSMALVRQLAKQKVPGIIATHDLALGQLETELPALISNAHFDVHIDNEDMTFDYKLYQGICTSLNASILMKKIGIEVD
jgi:hypothetical protein